MSVLVCFCFPIIKFNHTYRHSVCDQGVCSNLTMESIVLGHLVSKVFWIPAIGEELRLGQENSINLINTVYMYCMLKLWRSMAILLAHFMADVKPLLA